MTAPAVAAESWPLPAGWKSESFAFPLEFAPSLAHRGVEELRFAPGMFDPSAPGYWAYAFAWRLDDAADLSADQLSHELTTYFRGLLVAVDADKHRIANAEAIGAVASSHDDLFIVQADIIDAFASGQLVHLFGKAHRTTCGTGSLWTFALAPDGSTLSDQVEQLARTATCAQTAPRSSKNK